MSITFHSKPNNNNYITYVVYPGHFSRYSAPYFSWPCSSRWKDAKGVWWVQVFVYVFKIILICLHFFISFWQIWRKLDNAVWTGYSFCYHMFSQCSLAVSVFTVLSLFWSFKIDFFLQINRSSWKSDSCGAAGTPVSFFWHQRHTVVFTVQSSTPTSYPSPTQPAECPCGILHLSARNSKHCTTACKCLFCIVIK